MKKAKDRRMLRALIRSSNELAEEEASAFQSMWDMVDSGRKDLSDKQRAWVEKTYFKLGLDRETEAENLVSTGKVVLSKEDRQWLKEYTGPRADKPLKPPGRR